MYACVHRWSDLCGVRSGSGSYIHRWMALLSYCRVLIIAFMLCICFLYRTTGRTPRLEEIAKLRSYSNQSFSFSGSTSSSSSSSSSSKDKLLTLLMPIPAALVVESVFGRLRSIALKPTEVRYKSCEVLSWSMELKKVWNL